MSLVSMIGPRPNLLDLGSGVSHLRLEVKQPILSNEELEKIRHVTDLVGVAFRTCTLDTTWPAEDGPAGMAAALETLCRDAHQAVRGDYNILILSDRATRPDRIPIPALPAPPAVHPPLIRAG